MRRKGVIICFWVVFIIVMAYFVDIRWVEVSKFENYYGLDWWAEGLDGGMSCQYLHKDVRLYYEFEIKSGAMKLDLLDEEGNVAYGVVIEENSAGYISFDNKEPQLYHEHIYALSKDTVATSKIRYVMEYNDFVLLLQKINKQRGGELLGDNGVKKSFLLIRHLSYQNGLKKCFEKRGKNIIFQQRKMITL